MTVNIAVGSKVCETCFFVVRTVSNYNALLGRDWIHANKCVPSSMHQKLQMLADDGNIEVIGADSCPFDAEVSSAEARMYSTNVGPLSIPLGTKDASTLVNISKPITLEYLQDFRLKASNKRCFDDDEA